MQRARLPGGSTVAIVPASHSSAAQPSHPIEQNPRLGAPKCEYPPKSTPAWTVSAPAKRCLDGEEKKFASKACSILGPRIHTSMSRSCRRLASGLLLGIDVKIHRQAQRPKGRWPQSSQGEDMSRRHSGIPESVPNGRYDVAAEGLPASGETQAARSSSC